LLYSVYPNPAHNVVNVVSNDKLVNIQLVDITGKLIKEVKATDYTNSLDLLDINTGIYLINIKTTENNFVERIAIFR
jgi:Secretion system C-terminal sorting domain